MTADEIARAQREKRLYLLGLVLMIASRGLKVMFKSGDVPIGVILFGSVAILSSIFIVVMTWRFSRSIKIGIPMTFFNALTSPIFFIFQLIILLRIYSKRTGIKLTFLMGDIPSTEAVHG